MLSKHKRRHDMAKTLHFRDSRMPHPLAVRTKKPTNANIESIELHVCSYELTEPIEIASRLPTISIIEQILMRISHSYWKPSFVHSVSLSSKLLNPRTLQLIFSLRHISFSCRALFVHVPFVASSLKNAHALLITAETPFSCRHTLWTLLVLSVCMHDLCGYVNTSVCISSTENRTKLTLFNLKRRFFPLRWDAI